MVRTQISRRNYGVLSVRAVTGAGATLGNNTYICPVTKEMRIRNRVTWLIKKVRLQVRRGAGRILVTVIIISSVELTFGREGRYDN